MTLLKVMRLILVMTLAWETCLACRVSRIFFLVDAGQRNKGFGVLDAFLLEQCLVGAVAVDDDGFGQQNTQFLTAGFVDFDDFNRNAHLQQLARQIVGCFAAADNHSALT